MPPAAPPALILLDLGLPDLDGQEVLRRLRTFTATPVLVLSARDRESEKVEALDAGADDFVEKPFGVAELMARIRAALRHARKAEGPASEHFQAGPLEVDMARRLVRVDGATIQLSPREYALLTLMVRDAGRVLTHRQLLTGIWGPAHAHDVQYLRVYVGHLRQKLGNAAPLIATEPGVGYRLLEALEPPPNKVGREHPAS